MAGNLPVTTTTFESELQSKINTVGSSTSIEDIISYYRAGENIPTINNTALTDEIQLRLNTVSPSTTAEEFLALAASFGKISNTNQDDLQSALLAIADIPTNSELATALSPVATSNNVSNSESNIIEAIDGLSGRIFKATALGVVQSVSFSSATSPLVLTPPAGKVIKLHSLVGNVADTTIAVGGVDIITGALSPLPDVANEFNINTLSPSSGVTGTKDPIIANEPDQSITISTITASAVNIAYTVDYGDLV